MNDHNQVAVRTENPNAGVTLQQMERAADAMAKSGFYGIKTREEAMALMLVGQADGVHFAAAVRDFHIISGRPAMKADAMLARFQKAGGRVRWIQLTDDIAEAEFSHAQGGSVTISWDDARVKQAGLDKSPNHNKFPRAMKRARVISEGIRTVYPGVLVGTYTVEEAQDIEFEEVGRTQVTPAEETAPLGKAEEVSGTGLTDEEIQEHTDAINKAPDDQGLRAAFRAAWKHGTEAKDETAKRFFQKIYEDQKLARGFAEPV